MRDRLLIAQLCGQPLALHPSTLQLLAGVVFRHAEGVRVDPEEVRAIVAARGDSPYHARSGEDPYLLDGSVAVIGVGGVIAKHSSQVNGASQPRGTSTDTLRMAYATALADQRVGSVAFHIESPGGTVDGLEALALDIAAGRKIKPTVAIVSGMMASAAYWIGSQAAQVFADTATDEVGSIGVYTVLQDVSRAAANEGVVIDVVRSSALKGIGAAGAAISPEQRAEIQRRIDELTTQFVQAVARGRGVSEAKAREWATGQVWGATEATAMGLIDGVKRAEQVIAELNQKYPAVAGKKGGERGAGAPRSAANQPTAHAEESGMRNRHALGITALFAAAAAGIAAGGLGEGGGGAPPDPGSDDPGAGAGNNARNPDPAASAPAARQFGLTAADILETHALRKMYGSTDGVGDLIDTHMANVQSFNINTLRQAVAAKVAEAFTPANTPVAVGADGRDRKRVDIENALLAAHNPQLMTVLHAGGARASRVAEIMGFDSPELARKALRSAQSSGLHMMRLSEIFSDRLSAFGFKGNRTIRTEADFMAAGAIGSSDMPLLLSNLQNKNLQLPFDEAPLVWDKICLVRNASDYKNINVIRASGFDSLKLVLEGSDPEQTYFNERGEVYAVQVYALKNALTYQALRNDDLGEFMRTTAKYRSSANRLPEDLLFAQIIQGSGFTRGPVMADNARLWSATHASIANPAAVLSYDAVVAGKVAMARQKSFGPAAEPLNVQARYLLVPSELEDQAGRLYTGDYRPQSGTNAMEPNTLKGKFEPLSTPRMTGATNWALFADPNSGVHAFEVAFLDGRRDPYVNQLPQMTMLKMEWECVMPGVAVKAANWEGTYWNSGT